MSVFFGWVLAIGVPVLLVVAVVADTRAQIAHDRRMAKMRTLMILRAGGEGR